MAIRFLSISTFDTARRRIVLAVASALLTACGVPEEPAVDGPAYQSSDLLIPSRGISIPVTFVSPVARSGETAPLVVMAHGHGGNRHEQGSFRNIAERLAANGIASIRMDFPGSGDSSEPFTQYNLSNMQTDLLASRDFAVAHAGIDADRVGLFGWSMGGRLVLLQGRRNSEFDVIATWSPAASNDASSMVSFLGGRDAYEQLRTQAMEHGSAQFTTPWGQQQELGLQWFEAIESSRPLDAIRDFKGPLFVLYGDQDDIVLPEVSEAVIEAAVESAIVVRHVIKGADHGLGIFSDEAELTENAVSATVQFLSDKLGPADEPNR